MLTPPEFTAALNEYRVLLSDDELREYLESSFDKLKAFTAEQLEIFFDAIIEHDYLAKALFSHELTMEEGVELAEGMENLDDDESEVAFIKKVHMDDGVEFKGVYRDKEDFGKEIAAEFLNLYDLPDIEEYIDFKGFGEAVLDSYKTHECEGRLFVFNP